MTDDFLVIPDHSDHPVTVTIPLGALIFARNALWMELCDWEDDPDRDKQLMAQIEQAVEVVDSLMQGATND